MKVRFFIFIALILFGTCAIFAQKKNVETANALPLVGAYDVTFSLSGYGPRRLVFLVYTGGQGTFRLQGVRITTTPNVATPSVYDWITPNQISFSGEIQFPIGDCCRETGTLIFKGQRNSSAVITGQTVFVTNQPDATNPTGFLTRTGSFTANPLPIIATN